MLRSFRLAIWLTALAMVGVLGVAHAEPQAVFQPHQFIMLKQPGEPDRRCAVVSVHPKGNGLVEYKVKAVDTGEELTVVDRPGEMPPPPPPIPKETKLRTVSASEVKTPPAPKPDPTPTRHGDQDPLLSTAKPSVPSHLRPQVIMPEPELKKEAKPNVVVKPEAPKSGFNTAPNRNSPITLRPTVDPVPMSMPTPSAPKPAPTATRTNVNDPAPVHRLPVPTSTTTRSNEPSPLGFTIPVAPAKTTEKSYAHERRIIDHGQVLKESLSPSDRELAAMELANGAGATSPEVRSLLLGAAASDPAPLVRAACVKYLVRMNVRDRAFAAMLAAAKQDPDARVRAEAEASERK